MDFLNFDIVVGKEESQGYPFHMDSPAGACAGHLPAERLNQIQPLLDRLTSLSADDADLQELGRLLQFPAPVGERWQESRSLANRLQPPCGLRLRLTVEPLELARLPWEYLLRPGSEEEFLTPDPETTLVRFCANDYHPRPLSLPLRILVIAPSPDPGEEGWWEQLDSRREVVYLLQALEQLLNEGRVQITVVADINPRGLEEAIRERSTFYQRLHLTDHDARRLEEALGRWLRSGQVRLRDRPHVTRQVLLDAVREEFHVFHYVGHGWQTPEGVGVLLFEDERGQIDAIDAETLADALRGVHPFIVLNACETALDVAPRLVQRGLPAVVAMQYQVRDMSGVIGARNLYQFLITGEPVDRCVGEMRKALRVESRRSNVPAEQAVGAMDWGVPVLNISTENGRVWTLAPSAPARAEDRPREIKEPPPEELPPPQRRSNRAALRQYRARLIAEHEDFLFLGRAKRLDVENIYIALRVANYRSWQEQPDESVVAEDEVLPEPRAGSMEVDEALRQDRLLAVLGEPGSGKTTLLKHLALRIAKRDPALSEFACERVPQQWLFHLADRIHRRLAGVKTPAVASVCEVFTRLREVSTRYPLPLFLTLNDPAGSNETLEARLARSLGAAGFAYPLQFLQRKLERGECLILLDALDEVVDETAHRQVAEAINDLARYPGNQVVVTCRSAGFRGFRQGFCLLEVQEFNEQQVERFIENWFADHPPKEQEDRVNGLLRCLERSARMRRLAANPLLLSLIALLYEREHTLPERRVELYEKCAQVLLEEREQEKELKAHFPAEKKRSALECVAAHFHRQGVRIFSEDALLAALAEVLPRLGYPGARSREFLNELMERSGLLRRRSRTSCDFFHLTFQEFFTASAFHANREGADSAELLQHLDDPWWREVILLFIGMAEDATPLLERLKGQDVLLAAAALADARPTPAIERFAAEFIAELRRLMEAEPA